MGFPIHSPSKYITSISRICRNFRPWSFAYTDIQRISFINLQRKFSTQSSPIHAEESLDCLPDTISDILRSPVETPVQAHGWVRSLRHHKNVSFAMIFDGSSEEDLQVVLKPEDAKNLQVGCSLRVVGILENSSGTVQQKEITAKEITVLGHCPSNTYPLQNKEHSAEFLRTIPHFRPRTARFGAMLKYRSKVAHSMRKYLEEKQFTELHAPSIVFSDCEGGGDLFRITPSEEFFGRQAYLSISAQLHAEIGASSIGRVFTFGPIFRAEKLNTSRHLTEFPMLEVEIPFVESIHRLMDFAESLLVKSILDTVAVPSLQNFPMIKERSAVLTERPFARLSYSDAIAELEKAVVTEERKFAHPVSWGMSLQTEHERYLAEELSQGPVFVYDYPAPVKAFYMKINGSPSGEAEWRKSTVACFDLLLPHVTEVIGGSIREDRYDILRDSTNYAGLNISDYEWYADMRKHGSTPHGGFGLGFDRFIQYLTATSNIRDVAFIPRAPGQVLC